MRLRGGDRWERKETVLCWRWWHRGEVGTGSENSEEHVDLLGFSSRQRGIRVPDGACNYLERSLPLGTRNTL